MPIGYVIDRARDRVHVFIEDRVDFRDAANYIESITRDPHYGPHTDVLVELTTTTEVVLSATEIRELASQDPTPAGARFALVAPTKLLYGLSRMYLSFVEGQSARYRVFRGLADAEAWLDGPRSASQPLAPKPRAPSA